MCDLRGSKNVHVAFGLFDGFLWANRRAQVPVIRSISMNFDFFSSGFNEIKVKISKDEFALLSSERVVVFREMNVHNSRGRNGRVERGRVGRS